MCSISFFFLRIKHRCIVSALPSVKLVDSATGTEKEMSVSVNNDGSVVTGNIREPPRQR